MRRPGRHNAFVRFPSSRGGAGSGRERRDAEGAEPVLLHGSVVALGPERVDLAAPGVDRAAAAGFDPGAMAGPAFAAADGAAGAASPRGVLITGASGSGKSALALALMALGARLVADDRVLLHPRDGALVATCPAPLTGLIEARGVGLLRAAALPEAEIALLVDLDRLEGERLPHPRREDVAGVSLPCLHKVEQPYFPAAILQYLKSGRVETA